VGTIEDFAARTPFERLQVAQAIEALPAQRLSLSDFGIHLPHELATDIAAVQASIEAAGTGLDPEEQAFAALTPQRAAQKRQAIAQRRSRRA
jgi:hypothetical protein